MTLGLGLLEELRQRYEKIRKIGLTSTWNNLSTGRAGIAPRQIARMERDFFSDQRFQRILQVQSRRSISPREKHELGVWARLFRERKLLEVPAVRTSLREAALLHLSFRTKIGNVSAGYRELYNILRNEGKRRLRETAFAGLSKLSRKLEPFTAKAFHRISEEAQIQGFPELSQWRYESSAWRVDIRQFEKSAEQWRTANSEILRAFLEDMRHSLKLDEIRPWDLQYGLSQYLSSVQRHFKMENAMSSLRTSLTSMGVSLGKTPVHFYLMKDNPLAYPATFPLDKNDIRVVLSWPYASGWEYYRALYHECGHALHFTSIGEDLLRISSEGCVPELSAVFLSHVIDQSEWLATFTRMNAEERKRHIMYVLGRVILRPAEWPLFWSVFETAVYKDMSRKNSINLNECYWSIYENYTQIEREDCSMWASAPFLTRDPLTVQSYFLAETASLQLAQWQRFHSQSLVNQVETGKLIERIHKLSSDENIGRFMEVLTGRPIDVIKCSGKKIKAAFAG